MAEPSFNSHSLNNIDNDNLNNILSKYKYRLIIILVIITIISYLIYRYYKNKNVDNDDDDIECYTNNNSEGDIVQSSYEDNN